MICDAQGSPAYSVTHPTRSKRELTAAALTCAAGFFTWAQPAIPARAAPAINQCNKNFFISKKSELLATHFGKSIIHAPHESDTAFDEQTARAAPIQLLNSARLRRRCFRRSYMSAGL